MFERCQLDAMPTLFHLHGRNNAGGQQAWNLRDGTQPRARTQSNTHPDCEQYL